MADNKDDSNNSNITNIQKYRDLKDMAEKIKNPIRPKLNVRWSEDPSITIIVATSSNAVIGSNNKIPWRLKNDMLRFKNYTKGKAVVMGINTFESLPAPLPDRINIVLTRDLKRVEAVTNKFKEKYPDREVPPIIHFSSINDLRGSWPVIVETYDKKYDLKELVVAGGHSLYSSFIELADKVLLTFVKTKIQGEGLVYFPKTDFTVLRHWKPIEEQSFFSDKDNEHEYKFYTFVRPQQAKVISFTGKSEISKLDRAATYEIVNKVYGNSSKPTN